MHPEANHSTVLFVDDEDAILEILQEMFSSKIDTVLTATGGEKALELARKQKIHLAVLDLKMPRMDGITLLKKLREIQPGLACMFLTGHGDKESVQAALRLGVEDFIDKPFDEKLLMTQVQKALEKQYFESLIREILELFIFHYSALSPDKYEKMSLSDKEKTLKAALGVARMKIMNKNKAE